MGSCGRKNSVVVSKFVMAIFYNSACWHFKAPLAFWLKTKPHLAVSISLYNVILNVLSECCMRAVLNGE